MLGVIERCLSGGAPIVTTISSWNDSLGTPATQTERTRGHARTRWPGAECRSRSELAVREVAAEAAFRRGRPADRRQTVVDLLAAFHLSARAGAGRTPRDAGRHDGAAGDVAGAARAMRRRAADLRAVAGVRSKRSATASSTRRCRTHATRQEAVHGGDAAALHEKLQEMLSSSVSGDQIQAAAAFARHQPSRQ